VNRRTLAVGVVLAGGLLAAVGAVAVAVPRDPAATPSLRHTVPAPIDALAVRVLESAAARYMLDVRAGLPSGCAARDSHSVARAGDTITLTVLNSLPTGDPICTMIYGSYDLSVDLGTDFVSGATYTVRANDRTTTFVVR
jgi:hypothetical protein